MNKKTKQIAFIGVIAAFAIILSYIESLVSFAFFVPGIKLGLANMAVVIVMQIYGNKEALIINFIRILITGLLFTNMFSIIFSLCGGVISFIVMALLNKGNRFSIMGISVAGGVSHNIGQICVAMLIIKTYNIGYYIPVLVVAGIVTGMIIGIISSMVVKYLKRYRKAWDI